MENDILKGLLGIGTGVTKTMTRTKRKVKPPTSDSSGTKRDNNHNNHNNKGEKDKGEGGFSQRRIITRKSLTLGTTTPYRNHRTRKRSDRGRFVGCYRHQSQQKPTPTPTPTTKTKNKRNIPPLSNYQHKRKSRTSYPEDNTRIKKSWKEAVGAAAKVNADTESDVVRKYAGLQDIVAIGNILENRSKLRVGLIEWLYRAYHMLPVVIF